jgi:hypothetical protein
MLPAVSLSIALQMVALEDYYVWFIRAVLSNSTKRDIYVRPYLTFVWSNSQRLRSAQFDSVVEMVIFSLTTSAGANRTNVDFTSGPTLQFVGLDTKGTPLDPATVKDDAIGGVTDPASITGRVKERAGTIASKLPNAPSLPNVRVCYTRKTRLVECVLIVDFACLLELRSVCCDYFIQLFDVTYMTN